MLAGCSYEPDLCPFGEKYIQPAPIWLHRPNGVLDDGLVQGNGLVYHFGRVDNYDVVSLEARSGRVLWKFSCGRYYHFGLQLVDQTVFFEIVNSARWYQHPAESVLVGLDARTGEKTIELEMPRIQNEQSKGEPDFWLRRKVGMLDSTLNFATGDGTIYQIDLRNERITAQAHFESHAVAGAFLSGGNFYWVLEEGQIVKLDHQRKTISTIFDTGFGFARALFVQDGSVLIGNEHGEILLFSLGSTQVVWKQDLGRSVIRPVKVLDGEAWINHGVDIEILSMKDGQKLRTVPFCDVLQDVAKVPGKGYLLNGGSCLAMLNDSLHKSWALPNSVFSDFCLFGDTLVYYYKDVQAIDLSQLSPLPQ